MDKLTKYLQEKKSNNKKINIGYLVAGYPNINFTKEFLQRLDSSALDVLELGIPYSDPLADGKTISQASFSAAQKGITTDVVFDMLIELQELTLPKKPVLFLVYYNLILAYGEDNFIAKAKQAGIQGFIVPDLPFEEAQHLIEKMKLHGISFVPLVSATSNQRIQKIIAQASGFIYALAAIGITGSQRIDQNRLQDFITLIKKQNPKELPIALGFGIKNKQDIAQLRQFVDAVIVGTALVEKSETGNVAELLSLIDDLFA